MTKLQTAEHGWNPSFEELAGQILGETITGALTPAQQRTLEAKLQEAHCKYEQFMRDHGLGYPIEIPKVGP